jgi:protein SCO1/2
MKRPNRVSTIMTRLSPILLALTSLATALVVASPGRAVAPLGAEFDGVDVKNRLGEKVDLDIPIVDRHGKTISLGDALAGDRPVLLTMNYYRCTSLCSVQLTELMETIAKMGWLPGEEKYRIVTLSFDPTDTSLIADGKRDTYTREVVRKAVAYADDDELSDADLKTRADALDWEFYVAREKSIRALSDTLGYYFRFEPATQQYAHSPVTYVLRPDGTINRYLFGLQVPTQDLRFALMETSDGQLGSFGEKVLLSCFAYDEDHGGYGAFAWGIMRLGAGGVAVLVGIFVFRQWRRERARRQLVSV